MSISSRIPPFNRRSTFLHLEAALAALAFAMPMTAGADASIEIKHKDGTETTVCNDLTACLNFKIQLSANTDPLTGEAGAALVPIDTSGENPVPFSSGNTVTITDVGADDWGNSKPYSVAGGGLMSGSGNVQGNTVSVSGSTTVIGGKVVGGISAATAAAEGGQKNLVGGGDGKGNKVNLTEGTVKNDVVGGVGQGKFIDEISYNEVTINNGGTTEGKVAGGWALDGEGENKSTASVHHNKVSITGTSGEVSKSVYGGYSQRGEAHDNEVSINLSNGAGIDGTVIGGLIDSPIYRLGDTDSSAKAFDNKVVITIAGGLSTISKDIFGGRVQNNGTGDVTGNKVTITAESSGILTVKEVHGGKSVTGAVKNNEVTIDATSGSVVISGLDDDGGTVVGNIFGGASSNGGEASGNKVTLKGVVTAGKWVAGGYSYGGNGAATGNTVNIEGTGGTFTNVVGGWGNGSGAATGNEVNIDGSATIANVYGGFGHTGNVFTGNVLNKKSAAAKITGNAGNFAEVNFIGYSGEAGIGTLNTTSGKTTKISVEDGQTITFANNQKIAGEGGIEKIGDGTLTLAGANTYSGATRISEGTLAVTGTLGTKSGDTYTYGGAITNDGSLTFGNIASATTQELTGNISGTGGLIKEGDSKLTLSGANTYSGATKVSGGTLEVSGTLGSGDYEEEITLENDSFLIFNQTASQTLSGGITGAGSLEKAGDGTLTLAGDNTYSGATTISAGTLSILGSLTGTSGVTVESGAIFELWNSAAASASAPAPAPAPVVIGNGDLAVSGTLRVIIDKPGDYSSIADLSSDPSVLKVPGTATIKPGAKLDVSLNEPMGDTLYVLSADTSLTGFDNFNGNSSFYYGELTEYIVKFNSDGTVKNEGTKASEVSKSYSEGNISSAVMLMQGSDVAADQAMSSAVSVGSSAVGAGPIGAMGGGSIRYKTGSHVDATGFSLVAGVAAGVGSGATVGGFIEYGDGSYDTYNNFSSGKVQGKVKGSGDTDYVGVGVLGHFDLAKTASGQPYLEATARLGRVKNEFKNTRTHGRFDTKSDYYGLSLGGGHVWNLSADATLDLYGRYVWSHQEGDNAKLSGTGQEIHFADIDSHRVRVGTRYSKAWNSGSDNRFYTGIAWEHEFDAEANAKNQNGDKIKSPDMKGSTGIVEIGLVLYPSGNKNFSIDLGLQGYGGKRQGATGSAQLKYRF